MWASLCWYYDHEHIETAFWKTVRPTRWRCWPFLFYCYSGHWTSLEFGSHDRPAWSKSRLLSQIWMHTNRKTSSPVSDLRIRLSEGGLPCDENTHVNTIMSWLVERLMSWINKAKVCLFRLLGLCSVGRTHPKQSLPLKRVTPIAYIPLLLICCLEEFLKQQLILEYEPSVCVCVYIY